MMQHPFLDVEQVGDAGGELSAFEVFEIGGMAAHDPAEGILGGEALFVDQFLDVLGQRGVFEQQRMSAEDSAVLSAELGADFLLLGAGLGGGGGEGLMETGTFG